MRLHPGMKAGLLLLAIAGTFVVCGATAQAGCCGGYYGGWNGGYGWYGGSPYYGYAYNSPYYGYGYSYPNYGYSYGYAPNYSYGGTYTSAYRPSTQPMTTYQTGGCGTTTAAYPPSGPQPGTPGGYNGTSYNPQPVSPTYAPGTNSGAPQPGSSNMAPPPPPGNAAPPTPAATSNPANH